MQRAEKLPNIVIIAIDSLRASHLGCYGYEKNTSPAIDALARESIVFDTAIAAGIPTMPSFTTICTGMHPYRHGIVSHVGERHLAENLIFLPQMLKARGYVTAACDNLVVQGSGRGDWFARGYDYYSGFLYKPFSDQSRQLTERALHFIHDYANKPLFLFMHYWDPHTPYGPLPPYDTMHYTPGSSAINMAEVRRNHPEYYDAFVGDMKLRYPDDYAYIVAQYDGEISQVDEQVGRIVRELKKRELWDNTIFVLLSDHGECFGEGNFYFDHHGLYDAVTRIACMMHIPGYQPRRIDTLISTEDILPTLKDFADAADFPYDLTGTSLLPLLESEVQEVRPYVVSAESTRQASLSLRTPAWKVILPIVEDAQGQPLPDFYGRPRNPAPLLFDLRADPAETHDLSREQPARLREMLMQLADWRATMAAQSGEPDPIQSQGLTLPVEIFLHRISNRQ